MGQIVMVLGKSGSGKSASLRNFHDGEIGIFEVAGKRLPFRTDMKIAKVSSYRTIEHAISKGGMRAWCIDDAGYMMQFDNFAHADEGGYSKFVDMAKGFYGLLRSAMDTDDDTITYFLMHPEFDQMGHEHPKTIGRMLDEKLCVEGLFPIVLDCVTMADENGRPRHVFVTESDGKNLAKAPMGMFGAEEIPNDLKAVDSTIREYWGMAPLKNGKE